MTVRHIILALLALVAVLVPASAQRIVSLMPSATLTLAQMEADGCVVGRTSYCPKASAGVTSVVVGDAMTVNVEAIVALKPDAVVASVFTKSAVVERLRSLGFNVVVMPTPRTLAELCDQTIELGRMARLEEKAKAMVAEEIAKIEALTAKGKPLAAGAKAYIQIGTRPLFGVIPSSYIGEMLARLGMRNIIGDKEAALSREEVMARKPERLFVSSMGGLGQAEAKAWRELTGVSAVVISDDVMCYPTPVCYRRTLQTICDSLSR